MLLHFISCISPIPPTEPPRPFDFIVDGVLLRTDLKQHLTDQQLSAESVIEIEYVPAVIPPKQRRTQPQEDWVTCVDTASPSFIVSGSSDGSVRISGLDAQGDTDAISCHSSFLAHEEGGVNALAILPTVAGGTNGSLLLTAGKDHTVKLWQLTQKEVATGAKKPSDSASGGLDGKLVAEYKGHTDSVESFAVNPAGDRLVSCGWDGALILWRTGPEVLQEPSTSHPARAAKITSSKKQKIAPPAPTSVLDLAPQGRLEGHLHCVSSAAWPVAQFLYSGGWDHSVRRWDVETGINTDTYNGSKVVHSLATCDRQSDLVAFGGADRSLRVWDSRSRKGEGLQVQAYASHASWISCVRWSHSSSHHIATSSHDGTAKVWDLRSNVALTTLTHAPLEGGVEDKVLCVGWIKLKGDGKVDAPAGTGGLVTGGSDCNLVAHIWGNQ